MEHFRRLGIAGLLRAEGLPAEVERARAYITRLCGHEFGRLVWHRDRVNDAPAIKDQVRGAS